MVDVNDDVKAGFRRIEVLTGPGRRRRWSAEEKARVVAETLEPGKRVSEIAPALADLPTTGIRVASAGTAGCVWINGGSGTVFVAAVRAGCGGSGTDGESCYSTPPSAAIEIKLSGAAVRVVSGVDGELLTAVLRAVRCSSGAA